MIYDIADEDVSEKLDFVPAKVSIFAQSTRVVNVISQGRITVLNKTKMPNMPINKGIATSRMFSQTSRGAIPSATYTASSKLRNPTA